MKRFTFKKFERLRRAQDITRAKREGRKRVGRFLVVWTYRRHEEPLQATRLGILIGRKSGMAVHRNLFKRRTREIFRLNKHQFRGGWDLLVTPKLMRGKAEQKFPPPFAELRTDFLALTRPLVVPQAPSIRL